MKKRVLVLNQMALPRSSAGGTRHVEIFGRLTSWDTTVIAGNKTYLDQSPVADEGLLKTVPVTRFKGNASRVVNWASYSVTAFFAGVRGAKPDVVYGSSPHMGAALTAWVIAKLRRGHFVLEVRDLWPQILAESGMLRESSLPYRALKQLERFLYRRADHIVVLAEGTSDYIIAEGIDSSSISFVPNGADPSDFHVDEARDDLRQEFGFDGFDIVYAGAHGAANGLEYVVNAAERAPEDSMVTFHLIGDGPRKSALQEDARSRGLRNIHFHDPIPKAQIPRLYKAADAGLHCLADHELFLKGVSPNKLYDYMAAALPVITNVGSDVADLVAAAASGVATEPDDILSGALRLSNAPPEALRKYGQSGQQFMVLHRSRGAMADQLADIFLSLDP